MPFKKNEFGIPQYPERDARKLFILLCAIDLLERPTLSAIADLTSHDRESIEEDLQKLQDQFGVTLHKTGSVYRIESLGDLLKKKGIQKCLKS